MTPKQKREKEALLIKLLKEFNYDRNTTLDTYDFLTYMANEFKELIYDK